MTLAAFLALASVQLMAAISPGPAVLMTARTGVTQGLRMGKRGRARVCNWRKRGIPARVKLEHPELFPVQQPAAPAANQGERDAA